MFGLLSEDGLRLTSESLLLGLVSPISNGVTGLLTSLVLRHFVNSVPLSGLAVRFHRLRHVHLQRIHC